ncbi:MAG: class I SAM-dependent methyltransferase [Gemmatimonadaceae bacterium]
MSSHSSHSSHTLQRQAYEIAACLVCGERHADVLGEHDDFRAEVEALWEYHTARLRADVPPQRLADRVVFTEPPPRRLVRCRVCGLVYRNPVERGVTEAYARSTPTHELLGRLFETQLPAARTQARRIRDLLGRGGTGLEVGSYVGAFLVAARDAGVSVVGVDVNPTINDFARAGGAQVYDGELCDLPSRADVDVVAIWNAFDQLADPRSTAFEAWRRLRPGGLLALRVPNGAFYARVRGRLSGRGRAAAALASTLLAQNNLLTFPYRWGFTPDSLRRLLLQTGFTVVRVRGDSLVRTSDEWTRPWARWEERVVKRMIAMTVRLEAAWAPWFEVFATRDSGTADPSLRSG